MTVANSFGSDDIRSRYKGMVVAVGGPPHSGKSVFLALFYRLLLAIWPSRVFLQRACPDGEGMWSAEAPAEVVRELRRKGNFDQEFMAFTLKAIENLGKRFPIVLVDLGGRRSAQNAEILARCTHFISLSSDSGATLPWIEFAETDGAVTIARLVSGLMKMPDGSIPQQLRSFVTFGEDEKIPVTGLLMQLERPDEKKGVGSDPYREAIGQFAGWLIAQVERR